MAHTKVYGFCDAKCKVEVVPKKGGEFTGLVKIPIGIEAPFVRKIVDGVTTGYTLFEDITNGKRSVLCAQVKLDSGNGYIYPTIRIVGMTDGSYYGECTSNFIGVNDNSSKILTIQMANKLPSLVHRYDNELIDGIKTFTSSPIIQTTGVEAQVSSIRLTDASSIEGYTVAGRMGFHWKDWKFNGALTSWRDANFSCTEITAGCDTKNSTIGVMQPLNGNDGYGVAPPTPSGANGNEIATAGWVNNKFAVVDVERDFYEDYRTHTYVLQNVSDHAIITGVVSYNGESIPFSGIFSYSKSAVYVLRDDIRVQKDSNTNCLDIWVLAESGDWEFAQPSLCGLDAIAMNF